ncbi:MAG TPA: class I SAM-dependent methyltransferase [bacterium]|jgi:ubiquinone/menaquinone biosynthesis C-methylase UbiE
MPEHMICPWWLGYALISPLRRLWQEPRRLLAPHVKDGMTVLEPGPGMGYFTLELARLAGPSGRVIAVDVQPKMLRALERRARKAGLSERIMPRVAHGARLGIDDVAGQVDIVLAFAVVHELPDMESFFREAFAVLKTGGRMLLAEPSGHVNAAAWSRTLQVARQAGLREEQTLKISKSHAALLVKESAA